MKNIINFKISFIVIIASVLNFFSLPSMAASQDDCSIWLCLPTGFPSGCGKAKSAFKHRIKHLKPPLPSFTGCLLKKSEIPSGINIIENKTVMTAKDGYAAYIPSHRVCTNYFNTKNGRRCINWVTIPESIRKNQSCRQLGLYQERPLGCTKTIRYVDTYQDGILYGETYYFDNNGNSYKINTDQK